MRAFGCDFWAKAIKDMISGPCATSQLEAIVRVRLLLSNTPRPSEFQNRIGVCCSNVHLAIESYRVEHIATKSSGIRSWIITIVIIIINLTTSIIMTTYRKT